MPSLAKGKSGWRRIVPVAEQGASSNTASNCRGSCQSRIFATISSAANWVRARFSATRSIRLADISKAVITPPLAAICMVLPPGAAQTSNTVSPGVSAKAAAGQAAAASCTHHLPSAKPSRVEICPISPRRRDPFAKGVPPKVDAQVSRSPVTVRSTGAPRICAVSMAIIAPLP